MDYTNLSILEASGLLQSGKVTSEELTKACIAKLKQTEHLNSVNSICEELAMSQAIAVDELLKNGKKLPVLAGVPITIKDNINYIGTKTTCASKFLKDFVSPYNANIVDNLLKNYAVIIAKNNMDEFAMGSSTENSVNGPSLNPHNNEYVCGGSSGGSACSVAANQCFASVGTDTGGSVRQPASLCGVVGLKPTYGTVSRFGIVAFASSLDQAGPLTKTVKDSAIMLNALAGHDGRDSTSLKRDYPNYLNGITGSIKGIKVGVISEAISNGVNEEILQNFNESVKFLEENGAEIVNVSMKNINNALACYYILSSAEAASNLSRFDGIKYGTRVDSNNLNDLYFKNRNNGFGKEVKRRIMLGNYVLSSGYYDAYYKKAKNVQKLIIKQFADSFKMCDVIICPTSPGAAFKIGEKINNQLEMYLNDVFTVPVNIAELPAISVPSGKTKAGLPIGLQFIGPKFSEQALFNVADYFEINRKGE